MLPLMTGELKILFCLVIFLLYRLPISIVSLLSTTTKKNFKMSYPEQFTGMALLATEKDRTLIVGFLGQAAMTKEEGQKLITKPYNYAPKQWSEKDVDIKISHWYVSSLGYEFKCCSLPPFRLLVAFVAVVSTRLQSELRNFSAMMVSNTAIFQRMVGSIANSLFSGLNSGRGGTRYPVVAGHEVIGEIVRAGADSGHTVGSRVGVGAQSGSCQECEYCKKDKRRLCPILKFTIFF